MSKSKNLTLMTKKIQKAYKNPKLSSKKFPEWFRHKTSEPIGFHDNVVVIQHKQMFFPPKKLVLNWLLGGLIHFDGTHWHIGTSLVDHTGFNGDYVRS